MACFERGNVQIAATSKSVILVFHFPSFQFSANMQELSSCSRSIKLLRELYSLQVTYNPLWRRLRQQNTSRRTVQKLQVRRKVVVYSKVVLWDILPHSVLEIIYLTDFFIDIKWYKNWMKSAMQMKNFCTFSSFLKRLFYNSRSYRTVAVAVFIESSKAEVHSCVEHQEYILHNLLEPRLFIDFHVFTYLSFSYQGSELSAVFQVLQTVLH